VAASKAIILYTAVASLPLLILILTIRKEGGGQLAQVSGLTNLRGSLRLIAAAATIAFLVKLPIFYFHI